MQPKKKSSFERSALEWQIIQGIQEAGLTFEEFAKKIGTSRANISRDLTTVGLNKASLFRIKKMAEALDMEFIPLLIPKKGKLNRYQFKIGAGEGVRTLDLKLGKLR